LQLFEPPQLTPTRIRLALAIAAATDVAQFLMGPLGWAGADEALDVAAMALTWRLIGFHPLLLPTFVLELVPFTDMLPTWTACVALVVARRKRQQAVPDRQHAAPDRQPDSPPTIEVKAERVE
jgi:hypothetical protein